MASILKKVYYFFSPREKAAMLNDDGEVIDYVKIKEKSNTFLYDEGTYNVKRNKVIPLKSKSFMFDHHLYFYNVGNADPLGFKKGTSPEWSPILEPKVYNILLEAEIIKKLNTVDSGFLKNLKPIYIIGVVVFIGILYYLYTTGAFGGGVAEVVNTINSTGAP
jgi:hypothetical protein